MIRIAAAVIVALILLSPRASNAQPGSAVSGSAPIDKSLLARQVREELSYCWNAYKKYAWGHDELKPLSKSFYDWDSSVSVYMTPVDAMDALTIAGLTVEADEARDVVVKNLSFDHDIYVKNFEITIRLLGGLLTNYQLRNDKRLLALAKDLGDRLLPAFNSPTGMPYTYVNLRSHAVRGPETNPAEIGTLLIEFGTLSKLTGDNAYYDKAKRALVELYNRRSPLGLVGSTINVESGAWTDSTSHITGGIDSYYEYLLKCWKLFGDTDCERMWLASNDAVQKYLAHETSAGLWYSQVNMHTGKRLSTRSGALDAFFPAVLALSGDLERARRLQESSYKMWTTFGIEPEEFDYATMKVTEARYPLRPEIIESAYYLYHFTGDSLYLRMGRTFFDSLKRYCRTDAGYAGLRDVRTMEKDDKMESFFLAETLKYLYLLFAPPETLDLDKNVFNTEAHPIRKTW